VKYFDSHEDQTVLDLSGSSQASLLRKLVERWKKRPPYKPVWKPEED
jgi:hypothetical protein